jgi:hypothetical protein
MLSPLHEVCRASLPREALPALAGLRGRPGVEVTLTGERAWVSWTEGDDAVLRRVLPVAGVELYVPRDGRWHRMGHHLPAFDALAAGESQPLDRVLFPAPVQPLPPLASAYQPVSLRLARDHRPRQASAGAYDLAELTTWAEAVPSARLKTLTAAYSGHRVLLLGERQPPLPGGERFWGERVLVPLGYRPEPALPESALRAALGAAEEELLCLKAACEASSPPRGEGGKMEKPQAAVEVEIIPRAAFQPLTRAGLRLAAREVAP